MQMPTLGIAVLIACDSNFGPAQKPADDPTHQGHAQLQYHRTIDMVFHMKTTLNIDDTVMAQLKRGPRGEKRAMPSLSSSGPTRAVPVRRKRLDVLPCPRSTAGAH